MCLGFRHKWKREEVNEFLFIAECRSIPESKEIYLENRNTS